MRHAKGIGKYDRSTRKKGRQQKLPVKLTRCRFNRQRFQNSHYKYVRRTHSERAITFSVSERKEFIIKEIKYNDNLYQIENVNKEIEIIKNNSGSCAFEKE